MTPKVITIIHVSSHIHIVSHLPRSSRNKSRHLSAQALTHLLYSGKKKVNLISPLKLRNDVT